MRVKAQLAMVMNLDKCIGCHTCSIPCKNVWTNRAGAEYMWFNNVESKPGIGYPKRWEDQSIHKGGWRAQHGRLSLRAGGRTTKLAKIFHNPDLRPLDAYYEPWTYDYERLISSRPSTYQPSTRPKSLITGDNIRISWGPNWEDDLAGISATAAGDVNFKDLEYQIYLEFKRVFLFYLPRLCEHCLNPACVASCPSGALYKRDEDGIVLVDQEKCRGWRYCVSGCPYKKVYFNWKTGRSEKCIFCYPRIETGLPTMCAESCVGRIRSIGVLLYDADRIHEAACRQNERELYPAQTEIFLDPQDPEVQAAARSNGVPETYLEAAKASPVYKLAVAWRLAFPPHPEFRTLPMVWYIPPLSPLLPTFDPAAEGAGPLDSMRIPMAYLANLFTAGDEVPIRSALNRLLALRSYMRSVRVDRKPDHRVLEDAGMTAPTADDMYRLLALSKYRERYVIPTAKREETEDLYRLRGTAGFPEGV
jgi:nitrate reductase beta subunit